MLHLFYYHMDVCLLFVICLNKIRTLVVNHPFVLYAVILYLISSYDISFSFWKMNSDFISIVREKNEVKN